MNDISIIIPVYNEEEEILSTIEKINEIMLKSDIDYELIIVNDGLDDKTGDYLKHDGNSCIVFEHLIKRGYGAALKTGITSAKYDNIVISDADGTYPNEKIPNFVSQLALRRSDG